MKKTLLFFSCLAAPLAAQAAPPLAVDLGARSIAVRADFSGAKVLVFGAVETTRTRRNNSDLVIALQGPPRRMTVRRKARIAGIWTHYDYALFADAPAYYALASTRPLEAIAPSPLLARLRLGENRVFPPPSPALSQSASFITALRRRLQAQGLIQSPAPVITRRGERLFRAEMILPAHAPTGIYTASVYLFERGRLLGQQQVNLHVRRTGFSQRLFAFAHEAPFLYGLTAIALALLLGWLVSLPFARR